MNIFKKHVSVANANDSSLVMYSLGGDRDAFCQIVTRYQNLLCSLAYSSLGDVKFSEDIAQETFVEAWRKLDSLQEPTKLRAWLCGILRFKLSHHRRKQLNQLTESAEELTEELHQDMSDTSLEEDAINIQQQALLWQALDQMEENYRQPLILFYRQQESIEKVAEQLELTEGTVKQRLSRGRKILKAAMSTFVEDALKGSAPGIVFTASVMTAISSISPPAKAALIGAGAVKASSMFSLGSVLALLASVSGLLSTFFGLRAALDQSRTIKERALVIKTVSLFVVIVLVLVVGMLVLKQMALIKNESALIFAVLSQITVFGFIVSYLFLVTHMLRAMRSLRAQERIFQPEAFIANAHRPDSKQREYKSKSTLFGVPLLHFQFGMPENSDTPAFGWIAGGSYARGLLFAWGGVAIAPVCVGIVSFGVISIGSVGIGLFGIGCVAVGFLSFGSAALGYKAYGSFSSLGWESAFSNGFSMAHQAAIGPFAWGQQINNDAAAELMSLAILDHGQYWIFAAIAFFVIVPSILHSNAVRNRMKK